MMVAKLLFPHLLVDLVFTYKDRSLLLFPVLTLRSLQQKTALFLHLRKAK